MTLESINDSDSKDFIQSFASSEKLFEGIELVMQATFVAAIKTSVESIAEAVISIFNQHNSDNRKLSEENLNDEMFVAWNGPEIGECDEILKNALDLHFKNKRFGVHFKTNNLFNTAGPTVTNVLKRKNKFNIY